MINRILKNSAKPGPTLAAKIAAEVADEADHQQLLVFYLTGAHRKANEIAERCPDAFKDFRATRDREDNKGIRVC
jgi:hypothetical protein